MSVSGRHSFNPAPITAQAFIGPAPEDGIDLERPSPHPQCSPQHWPLPVGYVRFIPQRLQVGLLSTPSAFNVPCRTPAAVRGTRPQSPAVCKCVGLSRQGKSMSFCKGRDSRNSTMPACIAIPSVTVTRVTTHKSRPPLKLVEMRTPPGGQPRGGVSNFSHDCEG